MLSQCSTPGVTHLLCTYVAIVVGDGSGDISAVQRRDESDVLPVLALQVFVVGEVGAAILGGDGHLAVLLGRHGLLAHVDRLVGAAVAVHDLLDGVGDRDVEVLDRAALLPRNPLFRRNNLRTKKGVSYRITFPVSPSIPWPSQRYARRGPRCV